MLEETVTVVAVQGDYLLAESQTRSSCSHCGSASSCSTSVIAKLFGEKKNLLRLPNSLEARQGDRVVIGIPDDLLVRASLWAYLLPLLSMIIATLVGNQIGAGDGAQVLFALAGLAGGFILQRRYTQGEKSRQQFEPKLLRIAGIEPVKLEMPKRYGSVS